MTLSVICTTNGQFFTSFAVSLDLPLVTFWPQDNFEKLRTTTRKLTSHSKTLVSSHLWTILDVPFLSHCCRERKREKNLCAHKIFR